MALKQEFAQQIEQQLAVWQGQIKEHHERLAQLGAQTRGDYEKSLAALRENVERGTALLTQARSAQEQAWKDMQDASRKAFEELQKGWAEALRRFT